ncbi:MAG TPA: hypothetical protein DHW82_01030 [Spirochaetia bacterium]|nr:MAG: hypothetical protein A2Y41_04430 [Spirochaetes bacterium GWB1_36_13]HCL55581.1 hypothetical protein [Spirochaetia bacterium]
MKQVRGSFLQGMGRIFDFSGSLNHFSFLSDQDSIYNDFQMVGNDMRKVFEGLIINETSK